jgi:tetratricopeptide (TPR) repeat protein
MNLNGKQLTFRKQRFTLRPYRILILLAAVLGGFFILRGLETQKIKPLFSPTPYPTRTSSSYAEEGNTFFIAGNLNAAITAYQEAVKIDPTNGDLAAELARIQTYSSASLTTDAEKKTRLEEALATINKGKEVAPDNSMVLAVRSFVLDWYSNPTLVGTEESEKLLLEANQEAVAAIQLDNQNTLALAYYAEILNDQQNWLQAEQYITQALQRDPTIMDVHRVNALIQETLSNYGLAIESYKRAAEITPNLTFLYINIGVNYRQLEQYEMALSYFAKAADINETLQVNDPIPYLAIGRTYAQMGEFFVASRNVMKALQLNPTNSDVYGQIGVIYFKARNYEGAIPALKCAVEGCTAAESCEVRQCDSTVDQAVEIQGLPLSNSTLEYYLYYSSALAGMHRSNDDYCTIAKDILKQLRVNFSEEPVVMQLVQTNEEICGFSSQ